VKHLDERSLLDICRQEDHAKLDWLDGLVAQNGDASAVAADEPNAHVVRIFDFETEAP
jgi:hypothetical protein